jgi:predicted nucleic acid-binding protein
VITLAELEAGIHAAPNTDTRALRLRTVESLAAFVTLPIDEEVAGHWARLRFRLHETKQHLTINDLWIASTALAYDLPVLTQDNDYSALESLGGPRTIHV